MSPEKCRNSAIWLGKSSHRYTPGSTRSCTGDSPESVQHWSAGDPGTGKTLLGLEFLVRGITQFDEPGVCVAFEETEEELATNMASLGYNLPAFIRSNKLFIDYVHIERKHIEETGEYDLEALFIRLRSAIEKVKAKRVLLDTLGVLFWG